MVTRVAAVAALVLAANACGGTTGLVEVTPENAMAFEPSVSVFRDGFTVAWYDTRTGHGQVYERLLDASARLQGSAVHLTPDAPDAYEPDVQAVEGVAGGDAFVVGWYEKSTDSTFAARLGMWSRHGAARWVTTLSPHGRVPVIRVHGELVFAAWIEDEVTPAAGLWTGWWNLKGEVVVAPRRVADASRTTYNLNAALARDRVARGVPAAVVVFDAQIRTKAQELYLAEDDGVQARVTRLTPDDGFASQYPDVTLSGTRAAFTWFDEKDANQEVYVSVGTFALLAQPDAIAGTRVTSTPGHSIGAYTAWNGDRLGLAWCDDTPGQHEIYFAEFTADGARLGETKRITTTRADSLIPAISAWRRGWVLTWIEYEGTGHDERGRSQVLLTLVP